MTGASLQTPPKCGNSAVIRMDSYEDKNPQGTLYLLHTQEEIAFTNLFELLEQLDRLAQCSESRASCNPGIQRVITGKREDVALRATPEIRGDIATFQIKIFFCANATWQGSLGWKEGKQELRFRSALEFVKLMDSALPQPPLQKGKLCCEAAHAG